jgi:hypothetical protein
MSGKEALRTQFDKYLNELMGYARQELVEGHTLTKPVRKKKMDEIDQSMHDQRDLALDYAEHLSDTGQQYDLDRIKTDFLSTNPFIQNFSGPRHMEEDLHSDLLEHLGEVANDLSALLDSDKDSFDGMMKDVYPVRDDAEQVLEKNFEYTDTIKGYGDHLNPKIGPVSVISFNDDILPVIERGEQRLETRISRDLDQIY